MEATNSEIDLLEKSDEKWASFINKITWCLAQALPRRKSWPHIGAVSWTHPCIRSRSSAHSWRTEPLKYPSTFVRRWSTWCTLRSAHWGPCFSSLLGSALCEPLPFPCRWYLHESRADNACRISNCKCSAARRGSRPKICSCCTEGSSLVWSSCCSVFSPWA